jgi:hypothetical protein
MVCMLGCVDKSVPKLSIDLLEVERNYFDTTSYVNHILNPIPAILKGYLYTDLETISLQENAKIYSHHTTCYNTRLQLYVVATLTNHYS